MKRLPPLLLFSLGAILFLAQAAEDLPLIEKQLLDSVLNDYDNRIRPVGVDNGAVVVRVNTYIRDISNLDMQRGTADLQITFRQQWQDPRLAFQSKASADKIDYLSLTDRNVLWMPDLFFSNSHTEQTFELMKPNVLIRIYPDGSILFSQRIALTVRMVFDDHDYPFDSQVIPLKIASYGYTTDKLNIIWKESDPVQVTKNLHLRDYNLHRFDTSICTSRTNTGEYACIRMDLQLDRMKSSIYKQVFIPTACLVILAYLTFFIDHKQPTLRLLYPLIVFAVLISMINLTAKDIPNSSQNRPLDIWTGYHLLFVFVIIIQTVAILFLKKRESQDKQEQLLPESEPSKMQQSTNYENWIAKIDLVLRVVFPIVYVFFVVVFFLVYSNDD